jgi:hypothetical protein
MEWDPSRLFGTSGSSSPYALLILNQPINEKAFGVLSKHGQLADSWYTSGVHSNIRYSVLYCLRRWRCESALRYDEDRWDRI